MDDNKDNEGASGSSVHSVNKWESASFGDDAQREKFLRLMGGMKKQHTGRFVIGETTSTAHTRTDDENKEMVKTLEHQFQVGIEKKLTGQNKRHVGLGFSEPEEEKDEKTKEMDEPKGTHTRFDDDGVESETEGKNGGEDGSRSKESQEKEGKDLEGKDSEGKDSEGKDRRDRDDKERKRDEPHSSHRDGDRRSKDRNRGDDRDHHRSHHRSRDDRRHRDTRDGQDSHEKREDRGKRRDEEAKTSRRDEERKHGRDERGSEDADDRHKKKRKSSTSD